MVGIALLILIGIDLTSTGIIAFRNARIRYVDWRADADAYSNADWVREYFTEQNLLKMKWHPFVYWRMQPFHGKYINVNDQGLRKTWTATQTTPKSVKIFMFGGSTMWGFGARDDHTIPSLLAKLLWTKRGLSVRISNFGELGYSSTQDMLTLLLEIQQRNVPDVVIFYDGLNDVYSAFQNQLAGTLLNEANREREFNIFTKERRRDLYREFILSHLRNSATFRVVKHLEKSLSPNPAFILRDPQGLTNNIVDLYSSNVELVQAMGQIRGFDSLFYWQPSIYTKTHLTTYEQSQAKAEASFQTLKQLYVETDAKIASSQNLATNPDFHDICHILDSHTEPMYLDFAHISECGNEVIAKRMVPDVLRVLERLHHI